MTAHESHPRSLELVKRSCLRRRKELEHRAERSRLKAHLRRCQRTLSTRHRVLCQHRSTLQEGSARCDAATSLGTASGLLQLEGHVVVGATGCRREVPRTSIRIGLPISGLRQCQVHTPALPGWCGPVNRKAKKRMSKPDRLAYRDQTVGFVSGGGLDAEPFTGVPDGQRVADRLRGGDEQQE